MQVNRIPADEFRALTGEELWGYGSPAWGEVDDEEEISDDERMGNHIRVAVVVVFVSLCGCKPKQESEECRQKAEGMLQSTRRLADRVCACTTPLCAAEAQLDHEEFMKQTKNQCPEGLADRTRAETNGNMDRAIQCAKTNLKDQ